MVRLDARLAFRRGQVHVRPADALVAHLHLAGAQEVLEARAARARERSVGVSPANQAHRLLADHLTSEYRVKTEGRGRTVDEWKLRVDGLDNHWLDCLVGCAVAASMQGATLFGTQTKPAERPRVRLSALRGARR